MASPAGNKAPQLRRLPATWKDADREEKFWREHFDEFLELYADHFVAVHDEKVVAVSEDLSQVLSVLQTKDISPRDSWIRLITRDGRNMLL